MQRANAKITGLKTVEAPMLISSYGSTAPKSGPTLHSTATMVVVDRYDRPSNHWVGKRVVHEGTTVMVDKIVRTVTAFITALIAVVISSTFGESGWSDVLTALLVATFVLAVDIAMHWAPKHSSRARNLLDPRAKMVGVWLQRVTKAVPEQAPGTVGRNIFALHWVEYKNKTYRVFGAAFDGQGKQHAQWQSADPPTFNEDGTVMSYVWSGEVISRTQGSIKRSGVTRIELFSDHRTGKGQSESVGENRILLFEIELITQATIATYGLEGLTPDDLKRGDRLREFAAAFATRAEASLPG